MKTLQAVQPVETLVGRKVLWTWTEGPTKGTTHEHEFHRDGSVTWKTVGAATGSPEGRAVRCAAERVSETVHVVSYLSPSGHTLTTVMNFEDGSLVGFASDAKSWFPVRGTFHFADVMVEARLGD